MHVPTIFEWDDAKAESNTRKHGITFLEAAEIFGDLDYLILDVARDQDGEQRQKVIGRIGHRLFSVVFVLRGGSCRLISARRANAREERLYGNRSIQD